MYLKIIEMIVSLCATTGGFSQSADAIVAAHNLKQECQERVAKCVVLKGYINVESALLECVGKVKK
jgi:hypothetical protein